MASYRSAKILSQRNRWTTSEECHLRSFGLHTRVHTHMHAHVADLLLYKHIYTKEIKHLPPKIYETSREKYNIFGKIQMYKGYLLDGEGRKWGGRQAESEGKREEGKERKKSFGTFM